MKIDNTTVTTIDYVIKDIDGTVLESSDNEPLVSLHGTGVLAPGLEKALEGREAGSELDITLEPEDGFGRRDENLVHIVSKDDFENPEDVVEGLTFQAEIDGEIRYCTVESVEGDKVTIDANHPLAGQTLHFWIKVKDVRKATPEELEHGHAHHHEHHHGHCDCGGGESHGHVHHHGHRHGEHGHCDCGGGCDCQKH